MRHAAATAADDEELARHELPCIATLSYKSTCRRVAEVNASSMKDNPLAITGSRAMALRLT
jgi:hypothetical protein